MRRLSFFISALFVSFGATSVLASGLSTLVPHRAVYDLELKDASERSGIKALTGRMVYEFNGSACDGFTTTFRYVTKIFNGDQERLADQQTTTFESGDGSEFRFMTKNFVDQQLDREVRGTALSDVSGLSVEIKKPVQANYKLGKSFFPTTHLVDMLARAEKGERFYEADIFDGTEDGDRTLTTTVVIGERNKAASDGPDGAVIKSYQGKGYFPVSVSYFDPKSEEGGDVPTYQIGFKLYDSGITRDLVMDYGDFSMTGKLVNLEMLKVQECK